MVSAGGLLLALEGIDGCGKSTQVARLARWLDDERPGRAVRVLREPGGTELGERVRALLLHGGEMTPLAETLLYMAARAELYAEVVHPALAAGEIVLLDRSHYSTAAYQGAGLGLDEEWIAATAERATGGRRPDRVLVLDLPCDEARARRRTLADDRIERRGEPYFERVAAAFRRFAAGEPVRVRLVDGRGTPEQVFARVLEELRDVL